MMKKHIEVVAAVIIKDDKYFCAQRKDEGELARKWEFPGGKVEIGETLKQSLIRELKEELKTDIEIREFIMTVNHEYETFKITLHAFLCTLKTNDINLVEHLDSKWLNKEELNTLDWAEADIPIVEYLRKK